MPYERVYVSETDPLATRAISAASGNGPATRVIEVDSQDAAAQRVRLVAAGVPAWLIYFITDGPIPVPDPAIKTYSDLTGFDGGTAFTTTGLVRGYLIAQVGSTAIQSTSGTTQLSIDVAGDAWLVGTIDGSNFQANGVWTINEKGEYPNVGTFTNYSEIIWSGDIDFSTDTDDITQGSITLYAIWEPVSSGATVVATP